MLELSAFQLFFMSLSLVVVFFSLGFLMSDPSKKERASVSKLDFDHAVKIRRQKRKKAQNQSGRRPQVHPVYVQYGNVYHYPFQGPANHSTANDLENSEDPPIRDVEPLDVEEA